MGETKPNDRGRGVLFVLPEEIAQETWELVPAGPSVLGVRRVEPQGREGLKEHGGYFVPFAVKERAEKANEENFDAAVKRAIEILTAFVATLGLEWQLDEIEPVQVELEDLSGELRVRHNGGILDWGFWAEDQEVFRFRTSMCPGIAGRLERRTYSKFAQGCLGNFEEMCERLGAPVEVAEDERFPYQLRWRRGGWTIAAQVSSAAAFPDRELAVWRWDGVRLVGEFRPIVPGLEMPVTEMSLGYAERIYTGRIEPAKLSAACPAELREEAIARLRATIRPERERIWEARLALLGERSKGLGGAIEDASRLALAKRVEQRSSYWERRGGYVPLSPDERRGGYYSDATVSGTSYFMVLDGERVSWPAGIPSGESAQKARRHALEAAVRKVRELRGSLDEAVATEIVYRGERDPALYEGFDPADSQADGLELECLLFIERADELVKFVESAGQACLERTDPERLRPLAEAAYRQAEARLAGLKAREDGLGYVSFADRPSLRWIFPSENPEDALARLGAEEARMDAFERAIDGEVAERRARAEARRQAKLAELERQQAAEEAKRLALAEKAERRAEIDRLIDAGKAARLSFGPPTRRMAAEGFWTNPKEFALGESIQGQLELVDPEAGWQLGNVRVAGIAGDVVGVERWSGHGGGSFEVTVLFKDGPALPIASAQPASEPEPIVPAPGPAVQAPEPVAPAKPAPTFDLDDAKRRSFKCGCGRYAKAGKAQMRAFKAGEAIRLTCVVCGEGEP